MLTKEHIDYANLIVSTALVVVSVITLAVMVIQPIISKYNAYRHKIAKYKQAIREGTVYDSTIKTLPQMSHYLLLKWIARHTDGNSTEFGFHSIVTKFNIEDPEGFLKYVVKIQRKQPAALSMTDGLVCLLKLK